MFDVVRTHGGTDALGPVLHDFSTNSNACGPCPEVWAAAQQADCRCYPDPEYRQLRSALANFHQVDVERIVLAGSASEFIFRITAWVAGLHTKKRCASVHLPTYHYGDYAHAAQAWGLHRVQDRSEADLIWFCEPSSPFGQIDHQLSAHVQGLQPDQWAVLDCAYQNLCLEPVAPIAKWVLDCVWQLYTPNKALGLTGIRGAYAIAPLDALAQSRRLEALAPSWVLGAQGVAMLQAWPTVTVQNWLIAARQTLKNWKKRQLDVLQALGGCIHPSVTNYGVWQPATSHLALALQYLRAQGIKCRDASSFGLCGHVRLGVLSPTAQDALQLAWLQFSERHLF